MKTLQDLKVGDEVCHDYDQIRKIAKITQKRIYLEPRGSSGFMPAFNRQTGLDQFEKERKDDVTNT